MTVDYQGRDAPDDALPATAPATGATRRERAGTAVAHLVRVIRTGDDKAVEEAVLDLSQRRRWLAPLGLIVGAFLMLFQGVKLLFTNWRLTLVQIVPAMWIWLALLDLKIHALHGKSFHVLTGPILIPCVLAVTALTAASFFLNAVFAFAISVPGKPDPARLRTGPPPLARRLAWGCGVGLLLSYSSPDRHPLEPLALRRRSEPRRRHHDALLPLRAGPPRRDQTDRFPEGRLAATAVGGAVGAVVCSPPYMLGRLGILMLGWGSVLSWFGIVFIVIGAAVGKPAPPAWSRRSRCRRSSSVRRPAAPDTPG